MPKMQVYNNCIQQQHLCLRREIKMGGMDEQHNPKLDRFLRGPVPAKAGARAAAGSGAATISSRY